MKRTGNDTFFKAMLDHFGLLFNIIPLHLYACLSWRWWR